MTKEKFEKTISLLKGVLDYESFKDVDMVIEVLLGFLSFVVLSSFPLFPPRLRAVVKFDFRVLETGCYRECFFKATDLF